MEPLIVDGTLDSLSEIAKYVMAAGTAAGLDKKAIYQLRLAVDEIATNIILHGYQENGMEGNVEVKAEINEKALTIALEDTAIAFDPTQKKPPTDLELPLEERKIGGLGVFLAVDGVDQFSYERVENRNRNIFVVQRNSK